MPNTEQETASLEKEKQQYSDHEFTVIPVQHAIVDVNNQGEEEIPSLKFKQNLDFNENDLFIDSTITEKIIHFDLIETLTDEATIEVEDDGSLSKVIEDPGDNQIFNVDSSLLESATNNLLHQPTTLVDRETAPKSEDERTLQRHSTLQSTLDESMDLPCQHPDSDHNLCAGTANSDLEFIAQQSTAPGPQAVDLENDLSSGLCMPQNVPESFKKALFWPLPTEKDDKKRRQKEKIPTVVTSREWQAYHAAKALKKIKKSNDIEERKRNRELASINKKREAEEKKKNRLEAAEEKKRIIEAEKERKRLEREEKARKRQEKSLKKKTVKVKKEVPLSEESPL
ncbi:PREDICTED: PERQ amino acid-rich with GYF domain-containing protein 2-like [Vollenhovia emeryi]|uniref:PERQ amino acid-rich with GYF domain-containing protein 2-like n=1 Tax=Vollenhovia emeryi TaxID=411798 RepID=UPI0005F43B41|nr:PREDICTED: PERQ amino acid-rich with GYF domain-containing protein 2-like [Vollenhovia emeryi]